MSGDERERVSSNKERILYIAYTKYLGERCVRAGGELMEEGSAWG